MSRTTTPVVIYLSTTASQISTLQSTVAGKADASTEITGGTFSDGTLTLEKQSGDIEIPIASVGGKTLVTTGDITQFIQVLPSSGGGFTVNIPKEFDIEYIFDSASGANKYCYCGRITIPKCDFSANDAYSYIHLGYLKLGESYRGEILITGSYTHVYGGTPDTTNQSTINYNQNIVVIPNLNNYRLYA